MEDTLPMITFVVLTTGLCIIALTALIFSDRLDEHRSAALQPAKPAGQPMATPRHPVPRSQEWLQALRRAA